MTALRIAVPKGRLQDRVLEAFAVAGFEVPSPALRGTRRLIFPMREVDWVFVKDADVPLYVEMGAAALGVTGRDQLLEQGSDVYAPLTFPFGHCRLMLIAGPAAVSLTATRTIATKYPNITQRFIAQRGLRARVVSLAGSVELAPIVGLAPYIVDLVETGATLREHGLQALETLEAIGPNLIVNKNSYRLDAARLRSVVETLERSLSMEVSS